MGERSNDEHWALSLACRVSMCARTDAYRVFLSLQPKHHKGQVIRMGRLAYLSIHVGRRGMRRLYVVVIKLSKGTDDLCHLPHSRLHHTSATPSPTV